jgi:uncharacterized membrane protein
MPIKVTEHRPWYYSRPFIVSLFAVMGLLHLFIVLCNHYYFRTVAFDYAVYNFAFYDYAHFRISECPIYHSPYPISFFQDHLSFLLPLLSPLYWLLAPLTGTYTLLILQWLFIFSGGLATYRLIAMHNRQNYMPLLAMLFYFLLYGRFSAYRADVNVAIMGSALVPVFLYFFERGKTPASVLLFLVLLITREDFALWLFFISLLLLIRHRLNRALARKAALLMLISVIYFLLSFTVLIPLLLEDDFKKYSLFDYKVLGNGPGEALIFIFTHPLKTIELLYTNHTGGTFYNNVKKEFYVLYLLSGGILLFLQPLYLIPFVPLIAKKMLNDNPIRWSHETYYSAEIVSILPVMVFLSLSGYKNRKLQQGLAAGVTVAAAILTVIYTTKSPGTELLSKDNKYNFLSKDFYQSSFDLKATRATLKLIPAEAGVSASNRIVPHLALRSKVYLFPRISESEYLLLCKNDPYPVSPAEFSAVLANLRRDEQWVVISESPELLLMHKKQ